MTWAELAYQGLSILDLAGKNGRAQDLNGSVVVYAPGHLGDFLQITPMLKALRTWAVGRKVIWLVGAWTMGLAHRYGGWADEICEFSPQQDTLTRGNARWKRNVFSQWRDLRKLRTKGVDILISTMPENPVTRFVANALRPRLWVGVGERRPPRVRADIQVVMLPFEKDCPEAVAQMNLFDIVRQKRMGASELGNSSSWHMEFPITDDDRRWATHFLEEEGMARKPFVLMAPGSGWSGKNWPSERFTELAVRLQTRGIAVAWTGSASEAELCRGPGRNWTGRLMLGQLAAVMERATVWIGNDSGPMHLAVAVGCRTVSFWGPTNENKWGGSGWKHTLLRGMAACPGCIYWDWRRKCPEPGHPCMSAISVGEAERALVASIGQKEARDEYSLGQRFGDSIQ